METVISANLLAVSRSYRSNDPTNSVIAVKDEDGRPDLASIPSGPHYYVTIIQHNMHVVSVVMGNGV